MKKTPVQTIQRVGIYLLLLLVTGGLVCLPRPAAAGGYLGIRLCLKTLIPSLFPFFVVSDLLISLGAAGKLGVLLEGPTRRLLGFPGSCSAALVLGCLGGYPLGAAVIADLYRRGACDKQDAQRLLALCNNSGPAFLFGVVGGTLFGSFSAGLLVFACHLAASWLLCFLYRRRGQDRPRSPRPVPSGEALSFAAAFTGAVKKAFASVLNVCAFVIFFRVLLALMEHVGLLDGLCRLPERLFLLFGQDPALARPLVLGIFELSSGIAALQGVGTPAARLVCSSFLLGWAGISVHFQVLSLVCDLGLSVREYLPGKLLHGLLAAALAAGARQLFPAIPAFNGGTAGTADAVSLLFLLLLGAGLLIALIGVLGANAAKIRPRRLKNRR